MSGLGSGTLGLVAEARPLGDRPRRRPAHVLRPRRRGRPADPGHQYGHGKAEHLAALAEATVLALLSIGVAGLAVARLAGWIESEVDPAWWAFAAVGLVIAIDVARTVGLAPGRPPLFERRTARERIPLRRGSRGHRRRARGPVAAAAGFPAGDSIAALFVAALVLVAAARLMRRNVDVLMDRAPADAARAAREAIGRVEPPVELRRLRLRQAAGRAFVDVVIAVPSGARPLGRRTRWPTASRRRWSAPCRRATSSSTSSRTGARRPCASGSRWRRWRSRGVHEIHNLTRARLDGRVEAVAAPEASGRSAARGCARDRGAGRAGDRRAPSRGRRPCRRTSSRSPSRAPAPRSRAIARGRAHRRSRRRAAHRGSCGSSTRTRPRRLPHARTRPGEHAGGGARAGERGRGADPRRASRVADVIVHTEP